MGCGCNKGVMSGGRRYLVVYEVSADGQEPVRTDTIGEAQAVRAQWGGGLIRSVRVPAPTS